MFQYVFIDMTQVVMSHANGYLQYHILHANIVTTWRGNMHKDGNWKQVWISNISSSGVNVSEEAWVRRQMLYHIISSEISTVKIPTSRNLHF